MAFDYGQVGPQPGFTGRDKVVPFIGYVENVNDKKHSNRVKVRIPGLHPYKKQGGDEDSLKDEDLPWARVCLPTTMPQAGRMGGTANLQPGSWVFGFMLDGEDGQDPMIVGCFNNTSRASEQYNRKNVKDDKDGENKSVKKGFTKCNNNENWPNAGCIIYKEQSDQAGAEGDPAADNCTMDAVDPATDSDDLMCKHSYRQMKEEKKLGNEESQIYDYFKADALCGANKHGRDEYQSYVEETMPAQMDRFKYNDAVWDKFTGTYVEVNAVTKQMAFYMANTAKKPLETDKAEKKEDPKAREKRAELFEKEKDRTGIKTHELCDKLIEKDDKVHGIFQSSFIDTLIELLMSMLQGMQNGGGGGGVAVAAEEEEAGVDLPVVSSLVLMLRTPSPAQDPTLQFKTLVPGV